MLFQRININERNWAISPIDPGQGCGMQRKGPGMFYRLGQWCAFVAPGTFRGRLVAMGSDRRNYQLLTRCVSSLL